MAISVILRFTREGDALATYDAIVDEMGVRGNPAPGAIYHWAAAVDGGLVVADVWETREAFEAFAHEKIQPLARKHGLSEPAIEVQDIHASLDGDEPAQHGVGIFVEWDGVPAELLAKYDAVNARIHVGEERPQGLVFHYAMATASGLRVVDHWRSRADFERFLEAQLAPAAAAIGAPQPRLTFFEIHNTLDSRPTARV